MNTVNISIDTSKVFCAFDAMVIRFSLLVSDFTFSAGDLHYPIMIEETIRREEASVKSKLEFIEIHLGGNNRQDIGMTDEQFIKVKANHKRLKNIKYKTALEIKHLKDNEKWVHLCYDQLNLSYSNIFAKAGMTQLKKFAFTELLFNPVNINTPEFVEEGNKSHFKMSDVLLDRFNADTPDDIYLVTGNFSDYLKEQNIKAASFYDNMDKKTELLSAKKILSFPHIFLLTTNELQMVREHLMSTNEQWRTNLVNWCNDLLTLPFTVDNFENISNRYKEDIEPNNKLLQSEIDKNERLNLIKLGVYKDLEFNINLYITSIGAYWDYLFSIKTITEETMTVLKNYPDYETLKNNSCIILEGCSDSTNIENEANYIVKGQRIDLPEPELTKRKTFDI